MYTVRVLEILKKKTTEEDVGPIILFHLLYFISKNSLKSVVRHLLQIKEDSLTLDTKLPALFHSKRQDDKVACMLKRNLPERNLIYSLRLSRSAFPNLLAII